MQVMLAEFTDEQKTRLAEIARIWAAAQRSTEPADREATEEAIHRAYGPRHFGTNLDYDIPEKIPPIIWCKSPLSLGLTAAFLRLAKDVGPDVELTRPLWDVLREHGCEGVVEDVHAVLSQLPPEAQSIVDLFARTTGGAQTKEARGPITWTTGNALNEMFTAPLHHMYLVSEDWWRIDTVHHSLLLDVAEALGPLNMAAHREMLANGTHLNGTFFQGLSFIRACTGWAAWSCLAQLCEDWMPEAFSNRHRSKKVDRGSELCRYLVSYFCDIIRVSGGNQEDQSVWRWYCSRLFGDYVAEDALLRIECLEPYMTICHNAGFFMPYENVCLVSERPTKLSADDSRRFHAEHEAALSFADGFSHYSWHGVRVPKEMILDRNWLSVGRIKRETNVEVRRAMLEAFGIEKYLIESNAKIIDQDKYGVLYRQTLKHDEALVMVHVENKTPEPDGSRKQYFMRVPPDIRSAKAAVAWTFGLTEDEYDPRLET